MKGIIFIALALSIYAAGLLWKNSVVEEKKSRHIPTTPEIQRNQGTPVNVVTASEGEFNKEFRVSGFLGKNGNLNAQVSPELIANIRAGQKVEMRDEQRSVKGVVTSVSDRPNLFSGLYDVAFDFKHFPSSWTKKLKVVYLPYQKIEGHLILPRAAVSLRDGTPKVYVVYGNKVSIQEVQITDSNNLYYAIKSGVSPGAQIVISDQRYLEESEKVKVVPMISEMMKNEEELTGAQK